MSDLDLTVAPNMNLGNLEKDLLETKKVEEAEVEKSLNYDALTEVEKQAIDTFLGKIDVTDTNQILQYGAAAQTKISKFSDSVLENVKTKSTGEVGGLLTDLVVQIKDFDGEVPKEQKGGLLGLFNSAKKQLERLIAKYDKVENNINKIENNLENHKLQMMKDIAVFDTMYEKNLEYFKELSL